MKCPNCGCLDHTKCQCLGNFCCKFAQMIVNEIKGKNIMAKKGKGKGGKKGGY